MNLSSAQISTLRRKLEAGYLAGSSEERLSKDPLGLLNRTLSPNDFEIISFIAAGLSYGRVEQIQKSFRNLEARLSPLGIGEGGRGIYKFLSANSEAQLSKELRPSLKGWAHRLNTSKDLENVLLVLSRAVKEHSSLAHTFLHKISDDAEQSLIQFSLELASYIPKSKSVSLRGTPWQGTGAQWFFANPQDKSTCKRLLMWMRWMCRKDTIDPGTWRKLAPKEFKKYSLDKNYLFWPIDTHILQWALKEKLVTHKTPSWKTSKELTRVAQAICPEDPIKYDFSICHSGMLNFRKKPS